MGTRPMPASDSGASFLAFTKGGGLLVGSGAQLLTCGTVCDALRPLTQVGATVSQIAVDARTGRAVIAAAGGTGSAAVVVDPASGAAKALPLKASERVFNAAHASAADLAATAGIDYAEGGRIVVQTWDVGGAQPVARNRKVLGVPQGTWRFGLAFTSQP
jgi:hypothetical protein